MNSQNLTMTKDFFSSHPNIIYWRLQVTYLFPMEMQNTTFDFQLNQSPENGFCSIDPPIGTMLTLFTINCSNWTDQDQIKDFTFYGTNSSI